MSTEIKIKHIYNNFPNNHKVPVRHPKPKVKNFPNYLIEEFNKIFQVKKLKL